METTERTVGFFSALWGPGRGWRRPSASHIWPCRTRHHGPLPAQERLAAPPFPANFLARLWGPSQTSSQSSPTFSPAVGPSRSPAAVTLPFPLSGDQGERPLSVCPNASFRSLHTVGAQFMFAPVGNAGESHGQVLRAAGSCSPGPAHPSPPSRSLPDTPAPEAFPPPDLPGCTLGTRNVQPWHLTSTEHSSLLHEAASFLSRERAKVTEHLLPFSPRPQCHHLTGSY